MFGKSPESIVIALQLMSVCPYLEDKAAYFEAMDEAQQQRLLHSAQGFGSIVGSRHCHFSEFGKCCCVMLAAQYLAQSQIR